MKHRTHDEDTGCACASRPLRKADRALRALVRRRTRRGGARRVAGLAAPPRWQRAWLAVSHAWPRAPAGDPAAVPEVMVNVAAEMPSDFLLVPPVRRRAARCPALAPANKRCRSCEIA